MKKLFLFLILAIALSSCSEVVTNAITFKDKSSTLRRDADIRVNGPQVITKPMLANLDVNMERKKTVFNTTANVVEGKVNAKKEAEQKAEFRFLEEHQCDFVMDPYFETEINYNEGDIFYRISVTLSGLPVTYKKFTELDSLPKVFFQTDRLPSRTLPLVAAFSANQKNVSENEVNWGFIGSAGLNWFSGDESELKKSINQDFKYQSKLGASVGLYRIFPLANRVDLRTEISLFSRNYSLDRIETPSTGQQTVFSYAYNSVGFDIPVLLDLKLSDQVVLHLGPSVNLLVDESISMTPDNSTRDILIEEDGVLGRIAFNAGINFNLPRYYVGARYHNQFLGSTDRFLGGVGLYFGYRL